MSPRTLRLHWSFQHEPRDELYRGLVEAAVTRCPFFLLTVDEDRPRSALFATTQRRLQKHLIERTPGRSCGKQGQPDGDTWLYRYMLDLDSARIVASQASGLYGWHQPELPGDLCLLRGLEDPWLVSDADARTGFLSVSHGEREELVSLLAGLDQVLAPELDGGHSS